MAEEVRPERLARIERKVDQFIDVQSRTNALIERRLEQPPGRQPIEQGRHLPWPRC